MAARPTTRESVSRRVSELYRIPPSRGGTAAEEGPTSDGVAKVKEQFPDLGSGSVTWAAGHSGGLCRCPLT